MEWNLKAQPGRSETCPQCRADLRACVNCLHHDLRAAHQCRESRAEPEAEKERANFCEFFEFTRRAWSGSNQNTREDSARAGLKSLLGDG